MKLSQAEQEALVALLTRMYSDIRDIEEEFELLVGDGDFRPRIEYFHDAVRAFTSGEASARLAVELLAYDVASLRVIYAKPLAPFTPHTSILSPSTAMVAPGHHDLSIQRKRPDRAVRERISDLYQHYAVLFSALLKPFADKDYHERVDNLNQDVEDLHSLVAECVAYQKGKGSAEKMGSAITHVEDDGLRHELVNFMHQQKFKRKDHMQKLTQFLKATIASKNKEIKAIDDAHMHYALAQLGIFEGSKDMLKTMAKQGMNLVGKFVEASIAESKRDVGR